MTAEQLIRGNEVRNQVAATHPASDVVGMLDGWIEGSTLGDAVLLDGDLDGDLEQIIALAEQILAAEPGSSGP